MRSSAVRGLCRATKLDSVKVAGEITSATTPTQFQAAQLPLLKFTAEGVQHLNPGEVLDSSSGTTLYDWKLASNAGRHRLRNKLVGLCSTETLHAFFGHWQTGTHPWLTSSCLDPQVYRADLVRSLPRILTVPVVGLDYRAALS